MSSWIPCANFCHNDSANEASCFSTQTILQNFLSHQKRHASLCYCRIEKAALCGSWTWSRSFHLKVSFCHKSFHAHFFHVISWSTCCPFLVASFCWSKLFLALCILNEYVGSYFGSKSPLSRSDWIIPWTDGIEIRKFISGEQSRGFLEIQRDT